MCNFKCLLVLFFILQTSALNANANANANAYCETLTYHRNFIEKTPEGLYLVQDFYPMGEKRSEPFLLKDEKEAKKKIYTLSFCGVKESLIPPIIEGKYTIYFKNGNKQLEGVYKGGIRIGIWRSWLETGQKVYEATYQEGNNFIGSMISWDYDGLGKGEGQATYIPNYIDRLKLIGYWTFWYWNKQGQLLLMAEGLIDRNENMIGTWIGWCQNSIAYKVNYSYQRENSRSTVPKVKYVIPRKEIEKLGCIVKLAF